MSEKMKIFLAVAAVTAALLVGFTIGVVAASSSATVYSTDPAQCPTDATVCQSVNTWRRASDAGLQAPNAPKNNRSSAVLDA
ncbi:hypothetical protein BKAS_1761 [Bifidobacterium catenulatum subsp. kashiwanohense JCM 15439 = DSM 21854]|nr:hypothetical protein BKAS_1761 [Bifidobacterium catenulatum subsp. kashiwanohense JCM 15439 = DSM 21854]